MKAQVRNLSRCSSYSNHHNHKIDLCDCLLHTAMCFNGAKFWQLGWYSGDDARLVSETDLSAPLTITVEGFVHPLSPGDGKAKVVKIDSSSSVDLYLVFNWQSLHNAGTKEAPNLVTIVEQGAGYAPSTLLAKLGAGASYTKAGYFGTKDVVVRVDSIDTTAGEAIITIAGSQVS